jgi:hypothetical protein
LSRPRRKQCAISSPLIHLRADKIFLLVRDFSRKCCGNRLRTPSLNTGHLPVIGPVLIVIEWLHHETR